MQRPCPLQLFPGHFMRPHAGPSKPALHLQTPLVLSHNPTFEHSAIAWAVSVAVAVSNHAGPPGQSRSSQLPPVYPWKQLHLVPSHHPWRLQWLGQPRAGEGENESSSSSSSSVDSQRGRDVPRCIGREVDLCRARPALDREREWGRFGESSVTVGGPSV